MRAWAISALVVLWGLGLGVAFVLAADEPAVPHPLAANGTPATDTVTPSPESPGSGEQDAEGGSGTGAVPTGPPKALLDVRLKDFKLVPDGLVGKAGTITFHLVNEGRYTHDFRVEGQGVDEKAPKVGQGRERDWKIELPPGTYDISCPISNHNKRGMTGVLVVK